MKLLSVLSLPALLGVEDTEPADHHTLPIVLAAATAPAWHPHLQFFSETAALWAPILGVVLVLVKIVTIIRNEIYRAPGRVAAMAVAMQQHTPATIEPAPVAEPAAVLEPAPLAIMSPALFAAPVKPVSKPKKKRKASNNGRLSKRSG